ncbi:hypothetical protein Y032_0046g1350 [Ancylostoma ceylanicum]|uniref:Uncharacterized protein n=1 Tax=Ancylostoma ceylanicum TaxID=53326 RepID=A0A016UDI9_9BILA|nr:hypothetical protein Y032_0046g1350 [Ancylostoma ceylanicum]
MRPTILPTDVSHKNHHDAVSKAFSASQCVTIRAYDHCHLQAVSGERFERRSRRTPRRDRAARECLLTC